MALTALLIDRVSHYVLKLSSLLGIALWGASLPDTMW